MTLGILAGILSALLWGVNPLLFRFATLIERDAMIVSIIRLLTSSILALIIVFAFGIGVSKELVLLLFLAALFGPGIGDTLFILAIRELGSGLASLISYQFVVPSQVLAVILLAEPYTLGLGIATSLVILALFLVLGLNSSYRLSSLGLVSAFLACIFWSIATIINKVLLLSISAIHLAILRTAISILLPPLLMIPLYLRNRNFVRRLVMSMSNLRVTLLAFATGVNGFLLAFGFFSISLSISGVHVATALTASSPIIAQILARTIAKEEITWRHYVAALLLVIAVLSLAFIR